MNAEKRKYTFDIFGENYMLVTDEAEQVITRAAVLVDATMREVYQNGIRDTKKLAILAALRIASLLESERQKALISKSKEEELLSRVDQELMSLLQQ